MDFRHLEYFEAIVEAGSLSQAAKKLGMTQPPLSHAMAKLEKELDVQVLERTPQGVRPTAAGLYLLHQGGRLLTQRKRITETLYMMSQGTTGELRLGVEPMVINESVGTMLYEFLQAAPDVRVTLHDVGPSEILRGIRREELDVGCVPFGPDQFAAYVVDRYNWRTVARIPLKLAVPAHRKDEHHPHGKGWGTWILPHRIPAFPGMPEAVESAVGDERGYRVLKVSSPQTAIPLVAAGVGVAPTTHKIAHGRAGVALVDPPSWLEPMHVTFLWKRDVQLTPVLRRWLELTEDKTPA